MGTKIKAKKFIFVVLALLVSGCGRANMKVPVPLGANNGNVGVVWKPTLEKPQYIQEGAQGLLEVVATNMIVGGPLPAKIETVTLNAYIEKYYLNEASSRLSGTKAKAFLVKTPLKNEDMKHVDAQSDRYFWIDFTSYKEKFGLDYVIYAEVKVQAKQYYFSVIATSPPKGFTTLDVYVIQTKDNALVGEFHTKEEVEPIGEWNEPPDYPKVIDAIEASIREATKKAYNYLF
jgi:hypothetical protein